MYETKDSGVRQEFDSGSKRDTEEGKPRYDLIPVMPLKRVAELYARGAAKYGEHNWTKGQPVSRAISSMLRHAFQYISGQRDEDHLAAVVFNAMVVMQFEGTKHDDRYRWEDLD